MIRQLLALCAMAACAAQAGAAPPALQIEDPFQPLELRVGAVRPGGVIVIDRGTRDLVQQGDIVFLEPRSGATQRGLVIQVDERNSVVELNDTSFVPQPGTRGRVLVPRARLRAAQERAKPPEPEPKVEPAAPESDEEAGEPKSDATAPEAKEAPDGAEDPKTGRWRNGDKGYDASMPLLARVDALRPEQRPSRMTGRFFTSLDVIEYGEDDRGDFFARAGIDLSYENPFGRGGELRLDGEFNARETRVPDGDDEDDTTLRFDRLSYRFGGTRFAPEGFEVGRFLQSGVPEFGVLDGVEWQHRRDNHHRYGASVGFMPEFDRDFESFQDFQVAGFYQWAADASETFTATGAYQKTFHNGAADRDLLIGKFQYLPVTGWNARGSAWVDVYSDGDDANGSGPDLTEAHLSVGRRFENGSGLNLAYTRISFPELDREEFLPVLEDQLDEDHNDRLALDAWTWLTKKQRLSAEIGAWADEDESGGDAAVGLDWNDLFLDRSRASVRAYVTEGEFSTAIGGRFSFNRFTDNGYWFASYEWANHDNAGFQDNNDDITQQAVRVGREFQWDGGWNLSLTADMTLLDTDPAFGLGVFLQRSF